MKCQQCCVEAVSGAYYCAKCGANLEAVRQIPLADFTWPEFATLITPLGWTDIHEGSDNHLGVRGDNTYIWNLWLSSKKDSLFARTSWPIAPGAPEGQLLNAVNSINENGWAGAGYIHVQEEDDAKSFVFFFSIPLTNSISAAEVDFHLRRVDREVEVLIARARMSEFFA